MSKVTYVAPTVNEYRTLIVEQVQEYEAGLGFGEVGEWYYVWHGHFEVGGFGTEAEAQASGFAWGLERWPGLVLAVGGENVYGAVKVIDDIV